MTEKETKDFLNTLNLGNSGLPGTLRHMLYVIGESEYAMMKNATKDRIISSLSEYFCLPGIAKKLWDSLSLAEQKIVSLHIWGGGQAPGSYAEEVAEEFGLSTQPNELHYYGGNALQRFKNIYASKRSKLWLLFPHYSNYSLFFNELAIIIGKMKRQYSPISADLTFTSRENRVGDFAKIVRCCNSNRLAATKSGLLNKTSALKLSLSCGYEELSADADAAPEDMRTVDGLLVTFPLSVLSTLGGLISVSEGIFSPGTKALPLLGISPQNLIKKIFESYLKSRTFDEISAIKGIKSTRGHNPSAARQNFSEEMKQCPPGQAVRISELVHYLHIASPDFARKNPGYVVETGNSYYQYGAGWDDYELPLIHMMLTFWWALGMIDIVWDEGNPNIRGPRPRRPAVFRINPLGSYVLGLSDSYSAPADTEAKPKGGFTVLPDYSIVVPDSEERLRHELYFEKMFTKVSSTEEAAVYRLDFETAVRALSAGGAIADIQSYLSASDKPLPENVIRALEDWKKQSERIRIRQVTILECDDPVLLEEIIRYKGMGELLKGKIAAAIVIEDGSASKIKKNIEKNKRFCIDVI